MTERDLERRAQRRLAVLRHVEEVSFNVAATCRYYGISRQCYYGWLRRYEADGLDGLKDRSQRPHHSPRATQTEVLEKIIWLRKHYHFGPAKIAMYLARYHDVTISTSGVWRILKRLGMNRLPTSQRYQRRALRWKRYEKQRPGHQLQVDVSALAGIGIRRNQDLIKQVDAQLVLIGHRARQQPSGVVFSIGRACQRQRQRGVQGLSENTVRIGQKLIGHGLPSLPGGPDLALK
jgi:transposase